MGTALIFLVVASAVSTPPVYLMQAVSAGRGDDIDPQLALWKNIKRPLTGADGPDYFNALKGTMVPTLKGKVVKLEPELKPKTVVLAIENGTTADATLKFEIPLAGKVGPGTELFFEGVVESYTISPYMLVFDVDPANLHGWTGKNAPPAHHAPVPKKTSTSK